MVLLKRLIVFLYSDKKCLKCLFPFCTLILREKILSFTSLYIFTILAPKKIYQCLITPLSSFSHRGWWTCSYMWVNQDIRFFLGGGCVRVYHTGNNRVKLTTQKPRRNIHFSSGVFQWFKLLNIIFGEIRANVMFSSLTRILFCFLPLKWKE